MDFKDIKKLSSEQRVHALRKLIDHLYKQKEKLKKQEEKLKDDLEQAHELLELAEEETSELERIESEPRTETIEETEESLTQSPPPPPAQNYQRREQANQQNLEKIAGTGPESEFSDARERDRGIREFYERPEYAARDVYREGSETKFEKSEAIKEQEKPIEYKSGEKKKEHKTQSEEIIESYKR